MSLATLNVLKMAVGAIRNDGASYVNSEMRSDVEWDGSPLCLPFFLAACSLPSGFAFSRG